MIIFYFISALYVIIILILGGLGMIEGIWALAAAGVTIFGTLVGIWLQGRKDAVRIKDVDDKTNKVEPTYQNTEKLLKETNMIEPTYQNTEKLLNKVDDNFKNADLRKVTEYVIKQDALLQAAKNTSFDLSLFVSQMQEQIKINAQLNQKVEELNRKINDLEVELFNKEQTILEMQENQRSRYSRDNEMEM